MVCFGFRGLVARIQGVRAKTLGSGFKRLGFWDLIRGQDVQFRVY